MRRTALIWWAVCPDWDRVTERPACPFPGRHTAQPHHAAQGKRGQNKNYLLFTGLLCPDLPHSVLTPRPGRGRFRDNPLPSRHAANLWRSDMRGRTDILRPCGQTHCHGGHAGHRFIAYIIFGADLIRGGAPSTAASSSSADICSYDGERTAGVFLPEGPSSAILSSRKAGQKLRCSLKEKKAFKRYPAL